MQGGHGAGQAGGADLGVVLAVGAVADVMQKVFDLPVASDPGGELSSSRGAGRQAGDPVDVLDGELSGNEVLSSVRELEGLGRVGVVDVGECGGLQAAVLDAVVGLVAVLVVEVAVAPGQTAHAVEQARVVGLHLVVLGHVVGSAGRRHVRVGCAVRRR